MRLASLRVAATLAASVASVTALAAVVQKEGSETWTTPSGEGGASHADIVTTTDYHGLQILTLFQYGHRPCQLAVEESALTTHAIARLDPLKACDAGAGEEWKRVDVGPGNYVTAIATCVGGKDDPAVHGIRVWGASISEDGKLSASKTSASVEFPECKKWQPKRMCPAGSVATGVRGSFSDGDGGFTGLALRCHALATRGK